MIYDLRFSDKHSYPNKNIIRKKNSGKSVHSWALLFANDCRYFYKDGKLDKFDAVSFITDCLEHSVSCYFSYHISGYVYKGVVIWLYLVPLNVYLFKIIWYTLNYCSGYILLISIYLIFSFFLLFHFLFYGQLFFLYTLGLIYFEYFSKLQVPVFIS